jgi:hypothetical protein
MEIGRPEERENPSDPVAPPDVTAVFGTRSVEPIWANGPIRRHKQAGHMTASDPDRQIAAQTSCEQGPSTYGSAARPTAS